MQPLQSVPIHHQQNSSATRGSVCKARNPQLSRREQLIDIGMLDAQGKLTFTPQSRIPSIHESEVSRSRLEEFRKRTVPSFSFTIEEYVSKWNRTVSEVMNLHETYLRGSYAFFIIDKPKIFELLIEEYTGGQIDFSDLIEEIKMECAAEEAPTDIDLINFCYFYKEALTYLTKKQLAVMEGLEFGEVNEAVKITATDKRKPLYPPPQPLLIMTLQEGPNTLDFVSGQPQRYYLFSKDNGVIRLNTSTFEIMSVDQGIWQAVVDRVLNQVRIEPNHAEDFQALLAAVQLETNGHLLLGDTGAIDRGFAQVAELDSLNPLIHSIKNRMKKHHGYPLFFLLATCQRLSAHLPEEDIETVYASCLEIIPCSLISTYRETIASFHALALVLLNYEDPEFLLNAEMTETGLWLKMGSAQLLFEQPESGPIDDQWIRLLLNTTALRFHPRYRPKEIIRFNHPVLDLLVARADQKDATPLSPHFLQHIAHCCLNHRMEEGLAALLHPVLDIHSPYSSLATALALARKGYPKEAADCILSLFIEKKTTPTLNHLKQILSAFDPEQFEQLFKTLFEKELLSEEMTQQFLPHLLAKNPQSDFGREMGAALLRKRNYVVFFQSYSSSSSHPEYDAALSTVVEKVHWNAIELLLNKDETVLHPHLDALFKELVQRKMHVETALLINHAAKRKCSRLFQQTLRKYLPHLPIDKSKSQESLRALLLNDSAWNNLEEQNELIEQLIHFNIKAPKPFKRELRPQSIGQLRHLIRLGYFPEKEKELLTLRVIDRHPEEFFNISQKEKSSYLKKLAFSKESTQKFVKALFCLPKLPLEKKFTLARDLGFFPWEEMIETIAKEENPHGPLECLIKYAPMPAPDSANCWRLALEKYLKKPKALKSEELNFVLVKVIPLYTDSKASQEVQLQLCLSVNPSQMDGKSYAWAISCLQSVFKEQNIPRELLTFYKSLIDALLVKPSLMELLQKAAPLFPFLPPSEEHANLFARLLQIKKVVFEDTFYESLSVQADYLIKPAFYNAIHTSLKENKRRILLIQLLKIWITNPNLTDLLERHIVDYILCVKWNVEKASQGNDDLMVSLITQLYNTPHGNNNRYIHFVYFYQILGNDLQVHPKELDLMLDLLPEICAKTNDMQRLGFYLDFFVFITTFSQDQMNPEERMQRMAKLMSHIVKMESPKREKFPPSAELVKLFTMILEFGLTSPCTPSLKVGILNDFSKGISAFIFPAFTFPICLSLFEHSLQLAICIQEVDNEAYEAHQKIVDQIFFSELCLEVPEQLNQRALSLLYWGLEKKLNVAGHSAKTMEFSAGILYYMMGFLLKRPIFPLVKRAFQIWVKESAFFVHLTTDNLLSLFGNFIKVIQLGYQFDPHRKEQWKNLLVEFTFEMIKGYSLLVSNENLDLIEDLGILEKNGTEMQMIREHYTETMKKPSSTSQ